MEQLIKQSFDEYCDAIKEKKYKGTILLKCSRCNRPHKITKLSELWRGFCECGKLLAWDYELTPYAIKIKWKEYEEIKRAGY